MIDMGMLKLILDLAVIPAVLFGYKVMVELSSLKGSISSTKEQNSKEHAEVIKSIKELGDVVRSGEKDNRLEHKELGQRIHELDAANRVEHAILSNGGKL